MNRVAEASRAVAENSATELERRRTSWEVIQFGLRNSSAHIRWSSNYSLFAFGSGAVGSSVGLPCQSGATFRLFQVSHAEVSSATIFGSVAARSFFSPTSFAKL